MWCTPKFHPGPHPFLSIQTLSVLKCVVFFFFFLYLMKVSGQLSSLPFVSLILSLWPSGVYRSLQQSYNISSHDVLMAMDYCEESLQEIDVTSFLQTLCGHIRVFREHGEAPGRGGKPKPSRSPATFIVGEAEEDQPDDRAAMASSSR